MDLSSPQGKSVNDAISPELYHLQYASVLDVAALVRHLGKGTTLAKIDLHQAYCIIPVHPDDHSLLGIGWQGQTCINTALPFGLNHHPLLTHLIRCLHFFTAKYNIHIKAPHIVGSCNMAADALSHNKLSMFFHSNPQAAREPSQIPAALVDMSLQQRLD